MRLDFQHVYSTSKTYRRQSPGGRNHNALHGLTISAMPIGTCELCNALIVHQMTVVWSMKRNAAGVESRKRLFACCRTCETEMRARLQFHENVTIVVSDEDYVEGCTDELED